MQMYRILRRIEKLEARYLPAAEAEEVQQFQARIEAGWRRLAEARARGELPPEPHGPQVDAARQRVRLQLLQALNLMPYRS